MFFFILIPKSAPQFLHFDERILLTNTNSHVIYQVINTQIGEIELKTADEIILEIKELPLEERQKVADFLISDVEEEFFEEDYAPEVIERILQAGEETEKEENTDGPYQGDNVTAPLKALLKSE